MDNELVEYLVRYYSSFLSEEEQLLIKHAKSHLKLSAKTLGEILKEIGWVNATTDTTIFFKKGHPLSITNNKFDRLIAENILKKHKEKISFNYCHVCGRLARTPFAKQCRNGHDWH